MYFLSNNTTNTNYPPGPALSSMLVSHAFVPTSKQTSFNFWNRRRTLFLPNSCLVFFPKQTNRGRIISGCFFFPDPALRGANKTATKSPPSKNPMARCASPGCCWRRRTPLASRGSGAGRWPGARQRRRGGLSPGYPVGWLFKSNQHGRPSF